MRPAGLSSIHCDSTTSSVWMASSPRTPAGAIAALPRRDVIELVHLRHHSARVASFILFTVRCLYVYTCLGGSSMTFVLLYDLGIEVYPLKNLEWMLSVCTGTVEIEGQECFERGVSKVNEKTCWWKNWSVQFNGCNAYASYMRVDACWEVVRFFIVTKTLKKIKVTAWKVGCRAPDLHGEK